MRTAESEDRNYCGNSSPLLPQREEGESGSGGLCMSSKQSSLLSWKLEELVGEKELFEPIVRN